MKYAFDEKGKPLYLKVCEYYTNLIENGKLTENTRLPSVKNCAQQMGISRTTVENAYMTLAADGYIVSKPRSGYYVTDLGRKKAIYRSSAVSVQSRGSFRFNFASAGADPESFNFDLWRRYIKSALRQDSRLTSYGEPQGEQELREVLASYIEKKRNVLCSPDNIVVGAGIQSILHILCPLISKKKNICFSGDPFVQGEAVFRDHGWNICDSKTDVVYTTPSHINSKGCVMSTQKRRELISQAVRDNILIIEDDYDSEFAYSEKKISSVQGLAAGENVVYAATFSRLLLPSIRMSFMVLPDELLRSYMNISDFYNQTASKTEQIALCQFIRDGHLDSHIRKQKKIYSQKLKIMTETFSDILGDKAEIFMTDSDIHIRIVFRTGISPEALMENAASSGVCLKAYRDNGTDLTSSILSCTSVKTEHFKQAAEILKKSAAL